MLEINYNHATARPLFSDRMEKAGLLTATIMTDEEARKQLPQIAQVLEEYQRSRAAGDDPPTALKSTLALLRELRGGSAYVPHRGV